MKQNLYFVKLTIDLATVTDVKPFDYDVLRELLQDNEFKYYWQHNDITFTINDCGIYNFNSGKYCIIDINFDFNITSICGINSVRSTQRNENIINQMKPFLREEILNKIGV